MAIPERQTAMMASVGELLHGEYVVKDGWQPNYVETPRGKVSRTSVIGAVIQEVEPRIWMVDDGSGQIQLRTFEPKDVDVRVGDVVHVIGRPREYGGSRFINYEIVKRISPGWLKYRKKELEVVGVVAPVTPAKPKIDLSQAEEVVVEKEDGNPFEKVLETIRKLDEENNSMGADVDGVLAKAGTKEAQHVLKSLMEEGEIFEIKPGKIKVLE